jgi:hypothetical protein
MNGPMRYTDPSGYEVEEIVISGVRPRHTTYDYSLSPSAILMMAQGWLDYDLRNFYEEMNRGMAMAFAQALNPIPMSSLSQGGPAGAASSAAAGMGPGRTPGGGVANVVGRSASGDSVGGNLVRHMVGGIEKVVKSVVNTLIGENYGSAWSSLFGRWVRGPTGGFMPQKIADGLRDVGRNVPESAAANGMHAWHAGSNAYLAKSFGLLGAPIILLGGLFHETPLDAGSFSAEQRFQGTVNHVLDSTTDVVANVFGMAIGYFGGSVRNAIKWGNHIPGPGELDPAFGGGGPYQGTPSDAWGQYPKALTTLLTP